MPLPLSQPSGSEKDEVPEPAEPAQTIPDKGGGDDTGKANKNDYVDKVMLTKIC